MGNDSNHSDRELELDRDACVEILEELVREKGKVAFVNACLISDGFGSGATSVHEFASYFWVDDEEVGLAGPYETLEDAVRACPACNWVHLDGELEISSRQLSASAIAELLHAEHVPNEVPFSFKINDQPWELTPEGEIRRARSARSSRR